MRQPKGRADGQHPVAHLQGMRIPKQYGGQASGVDLQHRNVRGLIQAQHLGREFAPVHQGHGDRVGRLHHVGIGKNHAATVNDEPRALVEEGRGRLAQGVPANGGDADHSRRYPVHDGAVVGCTTVRGQPHSHAVG